MDMFIADTHFGHENILTECRPHFPDVESMNRTLIDNINARMTKKDTLYVLGDFAYRCKTPVTEILESIRPRLILIKGNHDRDWLRFMTEEDQKQYFAGVHEELELKKYGVELHMSHYPRLAWNRSHFFAQSLSVCGHIHASRSGTVAAELFPLVRCQFNAGVDVNGYAPVTLEELVRNNTEFYGREYTREEQTILDESVRKLMK
jgi:calcineurin-like phosphoesterase family protein